MRENFILVDGNRIRYLESGDSGQTVILVHGLGASAERWVRIIPAFSDHYRVIAPDLVGFGYSDKPSVDYTPAYFTGFLEKFFDAAGIDPSSVVGSSLGGQIAVDFASTHQDLVQKLVLVSPAGLMKHSTPALDAYIMAALFPNKQGAKAAFEAMEGSGRKADRQLINGFIERMNLPNAKLAFMSTLLGLKNSETVASKLVDVLAPTLIVWGSNDPVIPIEYADEFVSSIPDCRFHRMDDCGHTPYFQEPDRFSDVVLDFLLDAASNPAAK